MDMQDGGGRRGSGPAGDQESASPVIARVLAAFLADQRARLSPRTYAKYRSVIQLLTHCLNDYAYSSLDKADRARFDKFYNLQGAAHREFSEIFGPEHIPGIFSEFLNYFMIRKVMAGGELLRAAGTVTRKLAGWLGEQGYIAAEEAASAAERGREAGGELPRLRSFADRLAAHCAMSPPRPAGTAADAEGHFEVTRLEPGRLWLHGLEGADYGPIALPTELTRSCKQGWTLSGRLVKTKQGWRFAEAWNAYPY